MDEKKYLIKIDLRNDSLIHLNPELYDVDTRCKGKEKKLSYGERRIFSEEDVLSFLEQKKKLIFENKLVRHLRVCRLCARREEFSIYYEEDLSKTIKEMQKIGFSKKSKINYKKIEQFLNDITIDVHNVVNNLHFFLSPEEKKLKESFEKNLWVFDKSISKGKKTLRSKQYLEGLKNHGFESSELERKLELYYIARDYEFPSQKYDVEQVHKQKWYRKLWNKVKKHLDIIDVILGSLSSVVPGLGAATEFKETVEHVVTHSNIST